jgi:hypothetical protein
MTDHVIACINIRCNKLIKEIPPVYRIFLDNQLVVERKFWPKTPDYFIQEQLTLLKNNNNTEHSITVKNVFEDRGDVFVHEINFFNGDTRTKEELEYTVTNYPNIIKFKL